MGVLDEMKFRVWWIPQIPMTRFEVDVDTLEAGRKICDVLADYDKFQFKNKIKPDYCNAGGIVFSHPQYEGCDWIDVPEDEDEWSYILEDIDALSNAEAA